MIYFDETDVLPGVEAKEGNGTGGHVRQYQELGSGNGMSILVTFENTYTGNTCLLVNKLRKTFRHLAK